MKHTPDLCPFCGASKKMRADVPNAKRVFDVVKACAGLQNPAEEIQAMRDENLKLRSILGGLAESRDVVVMNAAAKMFQKWLSENKEIITTNQEINQLRVDKARLVEFVKEAASGSQGIYLIAKAKQLLTEFPQ